MRLRFLLIVVALAALPGSPPTPRPHASAPALDPHSPLPAPPTATRPDRTKALDARDERAYSAVVTASYRTDPKVAGLRTIAPGSPLYEDAQGYLKWHEADQIVRAGTSHFHRGQIEQALLCLERALACDVLGPDARNSVAERLKTWAGVADRLALAQRLMAQKKPSQARAQLQQIVDLPLPRRNVFRLRAEKLIKRLK